MVHNIPLTYSIVVEVPMVDKEIFEHPRESLSEVS